MPTYAYRCPACGHEFEKVRKITANSRPKCPKCGKVGERVITGGVGLLFKGTGFYATDYKKSSPGKGDEGHKGQEGSKEQKEQKEPKTDKAAPKKTGDDR
jgi:putative FmdB family regulatory protein